MSSRCGQQFPPQPRPLQYTVSVLDSLRSQFLGAERRSNPGIVVFQLFGILGACIDI
jgi:hypothetical protein